MNASNDQSDRSSKTATVEGLPVEVEDFLLWMRVERGRRPATLDAYRRDLRTHLEWLGARDATIHTADEDTIVAYLQDRQAAGLARSTVARGMVAVRSLYQFLAAEQVRADDPTRDVELPKVGRGLPKALSEAEVAELLAAVEGEGPVARRDRAILEVLYGTGIRISELVSLSLGDVDLVDAMMRVVGKGDKERVVPLGRYAHGALAAWLEPDGRGHFEPDRWRSRDDADAVFLNRRGGRLSRQGGWGVIKKYGAAVGLGRDFRPTPSATVVRRTCSTTVRTSEPCKNCLGTRRSRPRRSTRWSRGNDWPRRTTPRTLGPRGSSLLVAVAATVLSVLHLARPLLLLTAAAASRPGRRGVAGRAALRR